MAVSRGDTHTIDVEGMASSIEVTMSQYDLFMPPQCCIFKTPIALKKHNEKAYIPDAFSIGPFHHGSPNCPNFEATERIKAKYLQRLISRFARNNTILIDLIKSVNDLEREAREYYAGPIDYTRQEFVKILVIDGCFMIELFYRYASKEPREENDPIFSMSSMVEVLYHDLILLENQVPWMVLEHLFSMIMAPISDKNLIELAIAFFGDIFPFKGTTRSYHVRDIKHILDLFKKLMVSSIDQEDEEENSLSNCGLIPSAERLVEAGLEFRMSKSKNMLDIKFTNGVLEIPQIKIHEDTETFFRNLISFEQCYPNSDQRITSYAILLDNLITTHQDVEILCKKKILDNWLNPEDVAQFFNKLYHDTYVRTYYHERLCREVNDYCEKRLWPRWRAVLVGKYFNTPWAGFSTLAAVILLILTLVQTWYAIMSYNY